MRASGRIVLIILSLIGLNRVQAVHAVEEGEFVQKDGRWEYYSNEDPGLKYLYLKGIITEDEYRKGLATLETRERLSKPNFHIDVNNGLNIRVGSKFLLKLRMLIQARFTHHAYNEAWGTIGEVKNNPEVLGGQVEFRSVKKQDDTNTFQMRRVQFQFLGYAFDPDFRYNVSFAFDQRAETDQEGSNGRGTLLDAYVSSWHLPYATVQLGQQRVWFNRALITSVATQSFSDEMIVQQAFAANAINKRDIGLAIMSDETLYRFNYAIGMFGGLGPGLTDESAAVSQAVPGADAAQARTYNWNTRFSNSELMYTARFLWNISGRPGYGQGDIQESRVPQIALAYGYAYNPQLNLLTSIRSDIVLRALRQRVAASFNGRLLGGGSWDLQTHEVDFIAKYRGWSFQAEGYYRHQKVTHDSGVIAFQPSTAPVGEQKDTGQAWGWYVQVGKYVIPRKLEIAARYGVMDPATREVDDLIKEAGIAASYSFDGTYNNRLILDYANITMGTGGFTPHRTIFDQLPGAGRDLIENRFSVQYQFFF